MPFTDAVFRVCSVFRPYLRNAHDRRAGAIIIVTVAVATSISGVVFAVADGVLFRSLPYSNPGALYAFAFATGSTSLSEGEVSRFRDQLTGCESIATYFRQPEDRFDLDVMQRFSALPVSANFFAVVGVSAAIGRTFRPDESYADRVVIISHGLWERRFGGRDDVLSQTLRFDGGPHQIIGVMPASFVHVDGLPADVWTPAWAVGNGTTRRDRAICRLRAGVLVERAQAELDAVVSRLSRADLQQRLLLMPLHEVVISGIRDQLLVLLSGGAVLLALSCVNVGSILLSRSVMKRRDSQLRRALGASTTRFVRDAAGDTLALTLSGGVLGLGLAAVGTQLLLAAAPPTLPRIVTTSFDARAALWVLGATIIVGLFASIAPALTAVRNAETQWAGHNAQATTSRRGKRLVNGLSAAEMAFATVLVLSAGVMVETVLELRRLELGFDPENVVTIYARPADSSKGLNVAAYYQELRAGIERVPGVVAVGAAKGLPLTTFRQTFDVGVGVDPPTDATTTAASWTVVPGYFEAMRIRLRRGRYFEPADDAAARDVVIVSVSLAQKLFGDADPVGRHVALTSGGPPRGMVIGVVDDVVSAPGTARRETIYTTRSNVAARLTINWAIRVDGNPDAAIPRIRETLGTSYPELTIMEIDSLSRALEGSLGYPSFLRFVLNMFAGAALVVAAIGIYGMGSLAATQRRREFGVRLVAGADRRSIVSMIMREVIGVTMVGVVIGVLAQSALATYSESTVYGLAAIDARIGAVTILILVSVSALASYLPAQRAARVDPVMLLRAD